MRLVDADALLLPDDNSDKVLIIGTRGKSIKLAYSLLKLKINNAPTIDPIRAAGGCYCVECRHKDDCIRRIKFIGRNPVLEQNTYEYHPLEFCSYGQRKIETVLPKSDAENESLEADHEVL